MKKIGGLLIILLLLGKVSCSLERKKIVLEVNADYGNIKENEVTYLLNDFIPFFDEKEYGFEFVLGMKITVTYRGVFKTQEVDSYKIDTSKLTILDIEYEKPKVYEYYYGQVPGSGKKCEIYYLGNGERFSGNYRDIEYVIVEDNNYLLLDELKPNQPIYLITSVTDDKENAKGFYSFNPI